MSFLLSERASWVSGTHICVDGAQRFCGATTPARYCDISRGGIRAPAPSRHSPSRCRVDNSSTAHLLVNGLVLFVLVRA